MGQSLTCIVRETLEHLTQDGSGVSQSRLLAELCRRSEFDLIELSDLDCLVRAVAQDLGYEFVPRAKGGIVRRVPSLEQLQAARKAWFEMATDPSLPKNVQARALAVMESLENQETKLRQEQA